VGITADDERPGSRQRIGLHGRESMERQLTARDFNDSFPKMKACSLVQDHKTLDKTRSEEWKRKWSRNELVDVEVSSFEFMESLMSR
jgi:hypothetical protein